MIRTICDVCGRESKTEKHDLSCENIYGGYYSQRINMCPECIKEIRSLNKTVENAFWINKGDRIKTIQYIYDEYGE